MKTRSMRSRRARNQQRAANITARQRKTIQSKGLKTFNEFGKSLKNLLGSTAVKGKLSEEELFAATAHQLIKNRYGNEMANDFRSVFRLSMADKPATERYASAERAAKETLKFFRDSTLLTREQVRDVRQLAFSTAQLDDNARRLWDNWGDTKAVTKNKRGQELIQSRLEEAGEAPVTSSQKRNAYTDEMKTTSRRARRRFRTRMA
jgi:hypothetical protein